jgi:hypothetical protein
MNCDYVICALRPCRSDHTGKEHYPSRAFEVMVNHRRKVLHCTLGFHGSVNDKTIIRFDKAALSIKSGAYSSLCTEVFTKTGERTKMYGCFHINDNGYHKWGTSMEPSKSSASEDEFKCNGS